MKKAKAKAKSNKSLAEAARKSLHKNREEGDDSKPKAHGILGRRMERNKEHFKGQRIRKVQYMVPTSKCRLWEKHNRQYDLLNETRCKDLIEGFKSTGKQEFPAIVRKVEEEGSEYEYEVICGARRHWTASYLGWELLVEVRELTDEEAFRLADIENRDREDISDYERALDYKSALNDYYSSQKQMAERLEVSIDWLSRFLSLADLPPEVVKAYRDITEIKVLHYRVLAPWLKRANTKNKLIEAANELHEKELDGKQVIAALKAAMDKPKPKKGPLATYKTAKGSKMMTVNKKGKDGLTIAIEAGATKQELKEALEKVVEELYE